MLFPALLVAGLFVLQGCEEDNPVEPDPNVIIEETILEEKSASIGPDGGTIALSDGMSAQVPPGALGGTTTVTVRKIGMTG